MEEATSLLRHRRRPRRAVCCISADSNGFFSSGRGLKPQVIILLISIAVAFLIPAFFPTCIARIRPRFVNTVWDALTVLLILLAAISGFLAQAFETTGDGTEIPRSSNRSGILNEDTDLDDIRPSFDEFLIDPLLSSASSLAERNFERSIDAESTSSSCRMEQSRLDNNSNGEEKDSSTPVTEIDQKTEKRKETESGGISSVRIPVHSQKFFSPTTPRRPSSFFSRLFSDKKKAARSKNRVHSIDTQQILGDVSFDAKRKLGRPVSSRDSQQFFDLLPTNDGEEMDRSRKDKIATSCPSPDVNSKADSFIANLRAGWQREKLSYTVENE